MRLAARVISDLRSGYTSLPGEHEYWLDAAEVDGAIPPELEGTLFRNGPGLLEIGGTKLNQPFDGDGVVVRLALKDGRAHFKNAYVRTSGYVAEQKVRAAEWLSRLAGVR